jgi:hypothetical protein
MRAFKRERVDAVETEKSRANSVSQGLPLFVVTIADSSPGWFAA